MKTEKALTITPDKNCQICPRLAKFREENCSKYPDFFNAPVPNFGNPRTAQIAIIGLAPGLKGANRTGRPFTGDVAGDLLYKTLLATDFATGDYQKHKNDSLKLQNCIIINAVKCVPPQNKPETLEIANCNPFLKNALANIPNLQVMIALGQIAHNAILRGLNLPRSAHKFAHGAQHQFDNIHLLDSYHCSRYNTQTKRLTETQFLDIFKTARALLH